MFVVFNRKMYVVDFYFQLFRSPMLGEVACGVATSLFRLFCAHESSISHSFSVYQVDIYAAHTSSIATRTPAAVISDGGWEEEIFEARGKHWESERRVTIVVVSFFYTENMAANRELVLVQHVVVFINRREHFIFRWNSLQVLGTPLMDASWMLRLFSEPESSSFFKKHLFWTRKKVVMVWCA